MLLAVFTKSLAFDRRLLAILAPPFSEILGYTLVFKNIRLGISNIRAVSYFLKSEKLTVNHVINLENDCVFPLAD